MVVSCISDPIKDDLMWWMQNRISTLENVKKLHKDLLKEEEEIWDEDPVKKTMIKRVRKKPMSKEGYQLFHDTIDDAIMNYTSLGMEFLKCPTCGETGFQELFETIKCIPREIKQDLAPYLRRRAKEYDGELAEEANRLADLFMNRVANCTDSGNVSYPWLHRRGFKKSDLIAKGNILQLP